MTDTTWDALAVEKVRTNGIELAVRTGGSGPAVVLAHGFPDLGYSWRHQVPALIEAGLRVIVPDMRGYGSSDRPSTVEEYDATTVGLDLIGLLDHFRIERAAFVGHDWGAGSVWPLALSHGSRVRGIAGISVPYAPAAPVSPLTIMRDRLGDDFYMVRFQEVGVPESLLERDVERTLLSAVSDDFGALLGGGSFDRPGWLSADELSHWVEAFELTGFGTALNYYRNIERNWEASRLLTDPTTSVPALFLTGDADPVARFMPATRMGSVFSHLQTVSVPGAGHWVHQEVPGVVNARLTAFLLPLDE